MRVAILQGPNLNLLGERETDIYGTIRLDEIHDNLVAAFPGITFSFKQSNLEGELINWIHEFGFHKNTRYDGIIINPGGYSHTSVAIADAIGACVVPVVEAHISNIYAREEYRHTSITGSKCNGVITGFGPLSYWLAVNYLVRLKG
jgi:3-dehydroquinate dehydratase II